MIKAEPFLRIALGFAALGFAGAATIVACSSSSSSGATTPDTDSGTSSDASTDDDSGTTDVPFIGVYLNGLDDGWGLVSNTYVGKAGDRCYPTQVGGGCYTLDCSNATNKIRFDNAGALTVTNASGDAIVLQPQSAGNYPFHSQNTGVEWAPGSTVTLSAAGSPDVPAYTQSITMPDAVVMTSPALADAGSDDAGPIDAGAAVDVPRNQDLVVTWTGSQPKVDIEIFKDYTKDVINRSTSLLCVVDGTTGTFTIPSAALMQIAASDGTTLDSIYVGGDANTQMKSGNATVLFDGRYFGQTPVGINLK